MIFERYDVVVVPFPFTDRATTLRRPAIILSDGNAFGRATGQSLMAMVTRAKQSAWPFDLPLDDLASAGLASECAVRMKLFTLANVLVTKRIGTLSDADSRALDAVLTRHLDLKGTS